ncbi:hypothetical protein FACS1894187_01560 [Synergistales bacterium]|nr:hypothetical protein FACS1894187_01560 [Synergistales bacterium]
MKGALGLIETLGLTAAVTALDAAAKTADVTLLGVDKVIGVGGAISVTLHMEGEVAAVQAAVEAGVASAKRVGVVAASLVIPRPHDELGGLVEKFAQNLKKTKDPKDNRESQAHKTEEIEEEKQ